MTKWLILLPLLFIALTKTSKAQTKLSGRIFELKTRTPLPGIRIDNLNAHTFAVSDTGGRFSIIASTGDRICSSTMSYKSDTLYLTNLKFKEIFLEPKQDKLLKEVTIINKEYSLGDMTTKLPLGPVGGSTIRYQTDANGNYSGGLKFKMPDITGNQQRKDKEVRREANDQIEQQIDKVFAAQNLQNYLPIKGQELTNFSIIYRPSIAVFQDRFNIAAYVNTCYQEFLKIPVEKRQSKDLLDINQQQSPL